MSKTFSGDLEGKVILVTGATQGVGQAVARRVAQWGGSVLLTGRNTDAGEAAAEALRATGAKAQFAAGDLADAEVPARLIGACDAAFGRIDGLVNAAALTDRGGWPDADAAFFDRMFAINARAPFLLMQGAINLMKRDGHGGSIVNVLSVNAVCGAPDLAVYSGSKGALATMTRNAANAHLRDRIRVSGVILGWTDTPNEHAVQERTSPLGKGWYEAALKTRPFGRMIVPDDVADLAAFLLSPHSGVMTGALIDYEQAVLGALR